MSGRLILPTVALTLIMAGSFGTAQVDHTTSVTDAMLQDPSPNDWLHWRRTLDGWGYSPLAEITTDNARQLRLVWSWGLGPGSQQTVPLVHDGVMYIANPGAIVHALDAAPFGRKRCLRLRTPRMSLTVARAPSCSLATRL